MPLDFHIELQEALRIASECAQLYKKHLDGRNFLIVYQQSNGALSGLETLFLGHSFMHLTGLVYEKYPDDPRNIKLCNLFYEQSLNYKLSPKEIIMKADGTAPLKLNILPKLMTFYSSTNMIGDYNFIKPKLYTEKVAGNIYACLGFVKDPQHKNFYVPNTSLKENTQDMSNERGRVLCIIEKKIREPLYKNAAYVAKGIDLPSLAFPKDLLARIDSSLLIPSREIFDMKLFNEHRDAGVQYIGRAYNFSTHSFEELMMTTSHFRLITSSKSASVFSVLTEHHACEWAKANLNEGEYAQFSRALHAMKKERDI
jgi:hypothetical protein